MNIFLIILQVLLMVIIGITLWQIWSFLKRKDIPENEPLGEERAKYLTDRLNVLQVGFIMEAVVFVIHILLQIMDQVS